MADDEAPGGSEKQATDEDSGRYDWPGVRVLHLDRTPRVKRLTALRGFCENTQHDHHSYDFAGRPRPAGARGQTYLAERVLRIGFEPDRKPPYEARKPDVPIPLPLQAVQAFDQMIYPRGLAPTIEVPADPRTERYLRAVMLRSLSWVTLQAARADAGKTGEAAIRVGVDCGKPISEVLDTRELHVRRWENQMEHLPREVVWQRLVEIEVETDKGLEAVRVWRTRVFDDEQEYIYEDVPEDYDEHLKPNMTRADGETKDTGWISIARWTEEEIEELEEAEGNPQAGDPKIFEHKADRCPIVWVTNTHTTQSNTGAPDCDGALHLADAIDLIASMNLRATRSNLDPTLHVKDELRWHRMNRTYAKGWGEVIRTSQSGDAKLLETAGTTVEMGWKTYEHLRREFLHTVQCVIIDPEHAGKYAESGVARAMLWRSMEAAAGKKRLPQELALGHLFELWVALGTAWGVSSTEDEEPEGIVLPPVKLPLEAAGGEAPEGYKIVKRLPVTEDEVAEVLAVHQVGTGKHVEVLWPAFHETTPEQFQATVTAVATATGQAKVLSQRSGVRMALQAAGMPDDVDGELQLIEEETEVAAERAVETMKRSAAIMEGSKDAEGEEEDDDGPGEGGDA
jgi:hypothetical protein